MRKFGVIVIFSLVFQGVAIIYVVMSVKRVAAQQENVPWNYVLARVDRACGAKACNAEFGLLQVAGDQFHGRIVRLTGYLAIYDGIMMIFPNEVDYDAGRTELAVQVRFDYDSQKALFEEGGYKYVRVMGSYDALDPTVIRANFLGAIKAPYRILLLILKTQCLPLLRMNSPRQKQSKIVSIHLYRAQNS